MKTRKESLTLSKREIIGFVHNAQLALCDSIPDTRIANVYSYKEQLLPLFQDSQFDPTEVATALVSVAYDLVTGRDADGTLRKQ